MSTAPQNTSYQALYRACMKEAAAQGRVLMQRMVVRAGDDMARQAATTFDEHEKKLLTEASRTLVKHETALCEAYPQALLGEFAHAIAGDIRKPGPLSFDALELMGDDQMHESVEQMRLQQFVAAQVEGELSDLNALVCAVQGLKSVQVERNPLRPEVYVRSLRSVILQSPVPALVRARWTRFLGEALGPELARVYGDLSATLRAQGVGEARFQAAPSPQGIASAGVAAGSAADSRTLLNVQELRRLLSGELHGDSPAASPDASAEAPPEFSMTMPAAFEALQDMKQVDQVVQRLKQRQRPQPGDAQRPGQALALEVVNLMVENIASDTRLLPPVQQTVRDLLPALQRLALEDPRFFNDRTHPARRLLEQMTQRSLAWKSVDVPGFAAFLEPLQQAVDALLSTHIAGAEPFDFALKSLEEAWGDLQQRDRRHRERAVRALLQAEQRNLLAEKISRAMRGRPDLAEAPHDLAAFITGPWSQVMAQARLGDETGSSDPGGYAGLLTDLIWSAQPGVASAHPGRLARLVPPLVDKLRHGLATIDYPGPATQRFLDSLAEAHRQALQPADAPARPKALSTSKTREELEAMFGDEPGDSHSPWLAPTEAKDSGFMETHQSVMPKPLFQQTRPAFADTRPPKEELAPALPDAGLQPGAWVEMLMDGGWGRFQVTWASPHGTLFMFAGANGKPHSMTRRLLDKMLKTGTLRMVSGQGLVDGALDAVAQTALRNSAELKP
ncbi:MAG TPA: DUF1631 family protein [Ramlibacter sp.]|nr:DUF1631 family protein [Ramlibacter sp.]